MISNITSPKQPSPTLEPLPDSLDLIILRIPSNISLHIELTPTATLNDLQQVIQNEFDLEPSQQILLSHGNRITTSSLSQLFLSPHTIFYLLSANQLQTNPVTITLKHKTTCSNVTLPSTSPISYLENIVSGMTGVACSEIALMYCGVRVKTGTLRSRMIVDGAIVHVNIVRMRARSKSLIVDRVEEQQEKEEEEQEEEEKEIMEEGLKEIKEVESIEDIDNELFMELIKADTSETDSFDDLHYPISKKLSMRSQGVQKVKVKSKKISGFDACTSWNTASPKVQHGLSPHRSLLKKIKEASSKYDEEEEEMFQFGQNQTAEAKVNKKKERIFTPSASSTNSFEFVSGFNSSSFKPSDHA